MGGDSEVEPSNVSAPVGTSVTAADPISTLKVIEPTRDDAAGTVIVRGEVTLTLRMTSSAVTGRSAELATARCFSARRAVKLAIGVSLAARTR